MANPIQRATRFVSGMFTDPKKDADSRAICFSSVGKGTSGTLGALCGVGFGMGLVLALTTESVGFGLYLMLLSWFHWSEWFCTALYNPDMCEAESFLLNHSPAYGYAFLAAITEYFVEDFFFPNFKNCLWLVIPSFFLCFFFLLVRFVSLVTAGSAFTHQVQSQKRPQHQLVTDGIYSYCRHPGYFGWFWWAVGSQLLLLNPFCIVGYAFASWAFFHERIADEEAKLASPSFFGAAYTQFKARTPTWIPFIP